MTPKLIAVAAITADYVIAINDQLPVHSPKDLAFFKQLTTGHHVIMGRKTFDTLGKPLPNRNNIVITRTPLKTDPLYTSPTPTSTPSVPYLMKTLVTSSSSEAPKSTET